MSVDCYPFDIAHDPAPDVQLVHTDAINKANRLAACIAARKAYRAAEYQPTRLPPRQRRSHLALLAMAFLLFPIVLALALVAAGGYAVVRTILPEVSR